jgi:hypothetical protein
VKRYVLVIYNDQQLLDALPESEFNTRMRGCLDHADELRQQGRLLDTQMLAPAATAKSVRVRNGRQTVLDGPFTEAKELLGGFNLIEAENIEEAIAIASEFPWVSTGCVEVREVMDINEVRQRVATVPAS